MIQVDLLPEDFRSKEKVGFQLTDLASSKSILGCLALSVIISVLLVIFKITIITPQYKAAQDLHFQHSPTIARIQALKAEIARLQDQERKVKESMSRPFFWTDVMNGFAESVVKGIWLDQIQVKKVKTGSTLPAANSATGREVPVYANILVISGEVISGEDPTATVSQFTSSILKNQKLNPVFQEVFVKDIKKKSDKNNLYTFEIHATFKESNSAIFEAFVS